MSSWRMMKCYLNMELGRGKGGKAWRHALDGAIPWYKIWYCALISQTSSCWQICRAVDSITHFQYHAPAYSWGKDYLKHRFWASDKNFLDFFAYPSAARRAKNMPVTCCKIKKPSKYWTFLILSCDKPGLCSSRARWPLAPNFCPRATRKSQIFHTNHTLGTLDFTDSEDWAPFNFP